MSKYAANTSVSVEKSRAEIESTLRRYGCDDFAYRTSRDFAQIGFRLNNLMVRFDIDLPNVDDFEKTPAGRRRRSGDKQLKAWEQACRQRWRALALVIKAKLEAVETGITSVEQEFLAHIVLPDGRPFHEVALPAVAEAYNSGTLPPLLPPPPK